jgi:hypothetical protein
MLTLRRNPLRDLQALRIAAEDLQSAYLVRTRLRRALLSVARDLARRESLPEPDMPGVYVIPDHASPQALRLAELITDIYQASDRMCQPSESLDARWRADWAELSEKLDELERVLRA